MSFFAKKSTVDFLFSYCTLCWYLLELSKKGEFLFGSGNMKAIVNGKIVLKDGIVSDCALLYTDVIEGIVPAGSFPADADIIITDESCNVCKTIIGGVIKYES